MVDPVREEPTPADWIAFRDRVAEAGNVARAAVTNMITALTSITMAIVGTAVTLGTGDFRSEPIARAMLFAMAGAGAAAVIILLVLAVEAILASRRAERWLALYNDFSTRYYAGEGIRDLPWDELSEARISLSVHWKVSLPLVVLFAGIAAAAAAAVTAPPAPVKPNPAAASGNSVQEPKK
jgi:hypothetical protein